MHSIDLKKFRHPAGVYRLEYPAYWDQLQKDEARSCGFGPHDRDDVGLWITVMPLSADTDRLAGDLPKIFELAMPDMESGQIRPDPSLRHHAFKADVQKEGEGGHHWLIAGGDVVLLASTQLPAAESDVWGPIFQRVMASLEITRDDELALRRLTGEVLVMLQERYPDQEFQLDEKGIRGRNQVLYLSNLHREVRESPARRDEIIEHFVRSLGQSMDPSLGQETWKEARPRLVPLLKPRAYIDGNPANRYSLTSEWLADVLICYALRGRDLFRFVTTMDVERWRTNIQTIHQLALENLGRMDLPAAARAARPRGEGRLILVTTGDSLASSRLLHPDLYKVFSGPLGGPFRAGIPDRDTLVLYSDRRPLRLRVERQLRKDYRKSGYPIVPRPFLVTADGIAPAFP